MTRIPPIAPPALSMAAIQPYVLNYELVTPMYGGGVKAHTVDEAMPIRASAIRGQLRFWWRLLAEHQWRLGDTDAIRKAEFALWGGMGDKDPLASKVLLKVGAVQKLSVQPWAFYEINPNNNRYRGLPKPNNWANVPYVLFPAQGKAPDSSEAQAPHALAQAGLTWQLSLAFDYSVKNPASAEQQEQVWQALQTIPYGQTRTYKDIATSIGRPSASRAVGAAIGRNPVSIIVPCHRVLGVNGNLTGFAGGLDNKRFLLDLEQASPQPI